MDNMVDREWAITESEAATVSWSLRERLVADHHLYPSGCTKVGPTGLRRCVDITDAVLITGSCVVSSLLFLPGESVPSQRHSIALSLLAICLALGIRMALRPNGGSRFEPAWHYAFIAAVSTGLAIVTAVVWWEVAFSDMLTAADAATARAGASLLFAPWEIAWMGFGTCASLLISRLGSEIARRKGLAPFRIAVVGDGSPAEETVRTVTLAPSAAWRCAMTLDDRNATALRDLAEVAQRGAIDAVVLAMSEMDITRIDTVCRTLSDSMVPVCFGLDPYVVGGVSSATGTGTLLSPFHTQTPRLIGCSSIVKRAMDLTGGLVLLVLVSPIMFVASLAVLIESGRPALFRQWRFGQGSRPVSVFKFRTMYAGSGDPTGERQTRQGDPRVTRVGRFLRRSSIDELPQLLNVVRGEMSLVGPRPHPLHMKIEGRYYFDAVKSYRGRHRVRPGITGWAQVNGSRGEVVTLEEARRRVELDLFYIRHWSLWLDLVILARTLRRSIFARGN